ncbi:hypothetical protein [Comamonas terrigena]|uniref:hypothetical protein n=1 Tax=Comamonas terrigena TaxID=32013 RepID=UPI00289EAD5F|nr:hypothetical protein [Comamonas terrigena]
MAKADTVCVFTARGFQQILDEGGSQAWVLDAKRAATCKYVVCVQNRHEQGDWAHPSEDHKQAFIVGRLQRARTLKNSTPVRVMLEFSAYAEISIDDAWNGQRNPVRYTTLEELGIDEEDLNFQPMPTGNSAAAAATSIESEEGNGLTIEQAKAGLAIRFGVAPEQIQITISA